MQSEGALAPPSLPEYVDWKEGAGFLEAVTLFYAASSTVLGPEGPQRVLRGFVDAGFLDVLRLPPLLGRGFRRDDRGLPVVLLAEPFWRARFGADPRVVGSTLVVDQRPLEVIGVLPAEAGILPDRPGIQLWSLYEEQPWMGRGLHFLRVFGRLAGGVEPPAAEERAAAMARGLRKEGVTDHGVALRSARRELVGDSGPVLLVLSGAVALLLLMVGTNLSHLFLAAAGEREREFAVRTALGASRSRLARQVLTESALLGLLGGAGGLVVSRAFSAHVTRAAGDAALLAPHALGDPRTLAFVVAVSALTSLTFGFLPARRAARPAMAAVLTASASITPGWRSRARRALLVGFEIALSLVLLTGATLMLRSLSNLLAEDPGFEPSGVLVGTVTLPGTRYPDDPVQADFWRRLLTALRSLPGVRGAALASHIPLSGSDTNGGFEIVGRTFAEEDAPHSKKRIVSAGYIEVMGIPLQEGRTFDATDLPDSPGVALVSRSLAERYWPGEDPVGRLIRFGWGPGDVQEIVGVVGDVRHDGLDLPGEGTIYVPDTQFPFETLHVVLQ
ncbi:MAG TPA: ABC transporter permease, partial [Longimicrobiales bacterium]|nr:ABC transporter permease [Longimicrobiales bacterium]